MNSTKSTESWRCCVPRNVVLRAAGLGWCPKDNIDRILPDIERLIKSVIAGHTDKSNVNMHFDELESELMQKLASILARRDVFFASRRKFFGFLKVSLTRHLKSHTQKFVYTYKRNGPKTDSDGDPIPQAGQSVSLDDDDHGARNCIGEDDPTQEDCDLRDELETFIERHLTLVEENVIRQEYEPNGRALEMAMEASRSNASSRKFRILDKHKAFGIGMQLHAYKRTLNKIRSKVTKHWTKA